MSIVFLLKQPKQKQPYSMIKCVSLIAKSNTSKVLEGKKILLQILIFHLRQRDIPFQDKTHVQTVKKSFLKDWPVTLPKETPGR